MTRHFVWPQACAVATSCTAIVSWLHYCLQLVTTARTQWPAQRYTLKGNSLPLPTHIPGSTAAKSTGTLLP